MAGIGKYKGSGSFSMKGSTFYGKSPLYQKQDKKTYPKSYTEEDKKFLKEQNEDVVREEDKPKKSKFNFKNKGNFDFNKKRKTKSSKTDKPKNDQVKLSKHEKGKGTVITGGSKSEEIIDAEDRIEFLNNDIAEEKSIMKKGKLITQRNKLKADLKKRRK